MHADSQSSCSKDQHVYKYLTSFLQYSTKLTEKVQYGKLARRDENEDSDNLFAVPNINSRICEVFCFLFSFCLTEINKKSPTNFDGNEYQIT